MGLFMLVNIAVISEGHNEEDEKDIEFLDY